MAFTYSFGQTGFKSKRVEASSNDAERGRLSQ
jgi:hypothetical protein